MVVDNSLSCVWGSGKERTGFCLESSTHVPNNDTWDLVFVVDTSQLGTLTPLY